MLTGGPAQGRGALRRPPGHRPRLQPLRRDPAGGPRRADRHPVRGPRRPPLGNLRSQGPRKVRIQEDQDAQRKGSEDLLDLAAIQTFLNGGTGLRRARSRRCRTARRWRRSSGISLQTRGPQGAARIARANPGGRGIVDGRRLRSRQGLPPWANPTAPLGASYRPRPIPAILRQPCRTSCPGLAHLGAGPDLGSSARPPAGRNAAGRGPAAGDLGFSLLGVRGRRRWRVRPKTPS